MYCKKCGFNIEDKKAVVCPSCGERIKKDKFPVWAIVLIVCSVLFLPFLGICGIVLAMILPSIMMNTERAKYRALFKKELSVLNQSIQLSAALNDKYYSSTDDVWEKSIKKNLNIESEIDNRIKLADLSEIKYEKLNDTCSRVPVDKSQISEKTACAELILDVNGFDKAPNKFSTETNVFDRYTLLLYSDKVLPIPNSPEYNILHNLNKR